MRNGNLFKILLHEDDASRCLGALFTYGAEYVTDVALLLDRVIIMHDTTSRGGHNIMDVLLLRFNLQMLMSSGDDGGPYRCHCG